MLLNSNFDQGEHKALTVSNWHYFYQKEEGKVLIHLARFLFLSTITQAGEEDSGNKKNAVTTVAKNAQRQQCWYSTSVEPISETLKCKRDMRTRLHHLTLRSVRTGCERLLEKQSKCHPAA